MTVRRLPHVGLSASVPGESLYGDESTIDARGQAEREAVYRQMSDFLYSEATQRLMADQVAEMRRPPIRVIATCRPTDRAEAVSGTQATSQCATCVRFTSTFARGHGPDGTYSLPSNCAAYPVGIPEEIYENLLDHREPLPDDHGLQWSSNGIPFPEYAMATPVGLVAQIGDTASMQTYVMTAAALGDAQTGAMVALVPSGADAARLAVPGGETVDQLHCTIAYLGLAADISDLQQRGLLDWAADAASAWPAIEADAFAVALFNPTGPEPCVTVLLNGDDLADFHDTSIAEISDIVDLPTQHAPFIPHVSLLYGDDMSAGLGKTGPVTFDTLRVAFAGEINDFPLGGGSADATSVDPGKAAEVASATPTPESIASGRVRFHGCPYCGMAEGHLSGCQNSVVTPLD